MILEGHYETSMEINANPSESKLRSDAIVPKTSTYGEGNDGMHRETVLSLCRDASDVWSLGERTFVTRKQV